MRFFNQCLHAISAIALCAILAWPTASYSVSNAQLNVAEAADLTHVYTLDIPNAGGFLNATSVPYSFNNAASTGLYDRIAYYLELDDGGGSEFVYVSMDAFESNASKIGLPHNILNPVARKQSVSNMNVFSSAGAGVTTAGTGLSTGLLEMWPSNYSNAGDGSFNHNDVSFNTGAGYGSFQIHNGDPGNEETLLAYNRWGANNGNDDLGIGTQPSNSPDWTFAQNAATYTVKSLEILVHEVTPPKLPVSLPSAPAQIINDAPEAAGFKLVYELPVNNTTFNPNQYTVDNSAAVPDGSYDRIGYFLELERNGEREFVWVSMDAFNLDASLIGVPNTAEHIQQMIVNNMNVLSNSDAITDVTGVEGNIEFWRTNYGGAATDLIPGGTGAFDFDDIRSVGGAGYGSMQIHNFNLAETLIAYNRWNDGNVSDLGIGNQPTGNPDWTFGAQQQPIGANDYTVKNLYVLVKQTIPEPTTATLGLIGLAGLMVRRRRAA